MGKERSGPFVGHAAKSPKRLPKGRLGHTDDIRSWTPVNTEECVPD